VQKNKATQERYQPGSIFKSLVGLAALENGLNPEALYTVHPNPANPAKGAIFVNGVKVKDTADPGEYNFKRAIFKSSNSYFVAAGLQPGVLERIITFGEKLHLNERAGIPTRQDAKGDFPTRRRIASGWPAGQTANLCIGQGEIAVTPLQMTVMTCALANGGKVLETRLVQRTESQNPTSLEPPRQFEAGQLRDTLPVRRKNLQILHEAMLADTETSGATAYTAFQARTKAGAGRVMRVCGKTGTAERLENGIERNTVWFSSFAPYEQPRYAVVVMVEDGGSGGSTCAPIAADVYTALDKMEAEGKPPVLVKTD
jgi:penicillin-binding protein 2